MLPETFINKKSCCFTGHRARYLPQAESEKDALVKQLSLCVAEAVQFGVTRFLAGGADGFDMIAAEAVLRCRAFAPQTELVLALPSRTQAAAWPAPLRARYARILAGATDANIHYASECDNSAFSMCARNRYLVDHADCCIAYLTRASGGTLYTVNYALASGIPVFNLAEVCK